MSINNIEINAIKYELISNATILKHTKSPIQNVKTILICGSLFLARDFCHGK
ncbi:hypothetical protein GO684_04875 [Wolbachia endosymbiont of Litomosoides brasiliensis]|nr:hypothetical protein [Wolbachia endosymbiont of Litomosoides brasiliensis]NUY39927.1 hypothetical protein [Wolbachia endosymbiont of Litomosoides brasiliensis]